MILTVDIRLHRYAIMEVARKAISIAHPRRTGLIIQARVVELHVTAATVDKFSRCIPLFLKHLLFILVPQP